MKLAAQIRRMLPVIPLVFVLGYALVYALAWIQLYFQPHPYFEASKWMFENMPQGSILAEPHWDDKLPLSIPGKNAPTFFVMEGRENDLPVYERDSVEKLNLVLKRVSKVDYIVFPTPRTPDSIPRVPEEYFYTAPFLQLLFAERLGFTLVKSVKTRPSLFGITFNDDLADESFSVYDHPKAVIFKNVEKLSVEELRERVLHSERYQPLPTLNDILLMDKGGWNKTATVRDPLPAQVGKTFALILAMALSFWVLMGSRVSRLPDSAFGLSFLGGIALCAGLTWVLAALGVVPFTRSACVLTIALVSLAALVRFVVHRDLRRKFFAIIRSHGCYALASVLAGFVVVFTIKDLYPEYFWGGGEFDRFYLSFFARNDTIPFGSSWNPMGAGSSFYFGHFMSGWLVKLFGVSGPFAYELCFVLIGGLLGGLLYTAIIGIIRKPVFALFFVFVALIPSVRGVHKFHHGYDGVPAAEAEMNFNSSREQLVSWLMATVKGAPLVIEACDVEQPSKAALLAGLPSLKPIAGAVEGSEAFKQNQSLKVACTLQDPQAVFDAMMRLGIEVLIASGEGELPLTRQAASDALAARPDLFAKIYDHSGSVVLVPAFSAYFPRSYQKVAKQE